MRIRYLVLLIVLASAKTQDLIIPASVNSHMNTVKQFIDSTWRMSDTLKSAAELATNLKFLSGALGVLAAFGQSSDSIRHQQIMNEFARVHNGIAKLEEQISFLEANMEYQHKETRLFDEFEVLRQAMRLSSIGQRVQMIEYCNRNQCYHVLERVTRNAPDLLEAYIKSIGPEKDYVNLVAAYSNKLTSILGNGAIVVQMSMEDMNKEYIGLVDTSSKIANLLKQSKWRWTQIAANIRLDTRAIMQQGHHQSTLEVSRTLIEKLRPKFPWLSLGILVYNDICKVV